MNYYLAIDSGTSSVRSIIFDSDFGIVSIAQEELPLIYPENGWVEQDPYDIIELQNKTIHDVLETAKISAGEIIACGITNQRETTIIWDKTTGEPIYNAIVWQDRRTADIIESLKNKYTHMIRGKTGLVPDPYFSASKIKWILDRFNGDKDELAFGTVDSWIMYNMLEGHPHQTDYSNASRTMLFDIINLKWDEELLNLFSIPKTILPNVLDSNANFGNIEVNGFHIPIRGVLGDQQAALFGHKAVSPGDVKVTYGTGAFILFNTGNFPVLSQNNLLTTIAWVKYGKPTYALEGSVFIAGAVIQWLRDKLNFFEKSAESELLASNSGQSSGVYFIPAFVGLGAPYWQPNARGVIFGLTRDTGKAEITRAALEGVAYLVNDMLTAMTGDTESKIHKLFVDGGMSKNDLFLQFQSDISDIIVERPVNIEVTALGSVLMASGSDEFTPKIAKEFKPLMRTDEKKRKLDGWKNYMEKIIKKD
ncbi:MAG: glycerol kinase GlpK [Proteobacteria bacterium]|nr:glycerol kinase GlpK [Pseudomonadota bacterium]